MDAQAKAKEAYAAKKRRIAEALANVEAEAEAESKAKAKAEADAEFEKDAFLDPRMRGEDVSRETGSDLSGRGDPHLQNIFGQRFDLMQPGTHTLMTIPRAVDPLEDALFRVTARADYLGGHCADMYFMELNVTGQWVVSTALGLGGLR